MTIDENQQQQKKESLTSILGDLLITGVPVVVKDGLKDDAEITITIDHKHAVFHPTIENIMGYGYYIEKISNGPFGIEVLFKTTPERQKSK